MSDPVDEAVRKLAEALAKHCYPVLATGDSIPRVVARMALEGDFERVLTEQLAPLLRAGQAMCHSHNREAWDAAWAKLTGRTP